MMGAPYKSKKELKTHVGKPIRVIETSFFGLEYKANGVFCVVGPCPYTNRKWYAEVTMKNGLIEKVR